jgi:hypothetical protein
MLSAEIAFGTPRKLPKPADLRGRVVVLDIAFAGHQVTKGFDGITLPFIDRLGDRLRAWVDHHDHEEHQRFADDPRFVLTTKAEHGACPEMITPELVGRVGPIDTIVCHTDFDGLASAAKWLRGGRESYPGCDDDARAIDTRIGVPSRTADRIDQALRARPRDFGLMGVIVRHLGEGLVDDSLWESIDAAGREWTAIEKETRRAALGYGRFHPGVAYVDISEGYRRVDKTLLLLLGQEREPVSVVVDQSSVAVAARYDSGLDFVQMFELGGGMPTRISVAKKRLREVLSKLGANPDDVLSD